MTMRFFTALSVPLLLAAIRLPAQPAVQLSPGVVSQIMVQQPVVDVSPLENISATAMFDPPAVRAGETAFYRVTVDATENSVAWPDKMVAPPGLVFGPKVSGQVSRVEGNRFYPLSSFVYAVTAPAPGQFVVSNFIVSAGDKSVAIPTAMLQVLPDNSPPGAAARRLMVEVSQTNLFFGQPFQLRALLPAGPGNQIEALREVQFDGGGYLTDKINTRQSVEVVNLGGQLKPAFCYETEATPLAAGPVTVSAQGFTAGRDFGGPITISGNGQPVVLSGGPPAYVLLVSDPVQLNVRPLPVAGELPGFTGALGRFAADPPQLTTNRLRIGEPVHLKAGFKPVTDLTRFVPPAAPRSRAWQIIADPLPGTGFTLVPLTDDVTETPAIPFSAFDPATESYYDLTIPPLPVTVTGDGLPVQLPAWSADDKNSAPPKLSGLATTPGCSLALLKPLQLQGWFVFLQILPVYGLYLLWQWDRRRRFLEAHPEILRRRQALRALRRERKNLRRAVAAGDAEQFAQSAAAAMRIATAPHYPAEARALVGGDVLQQLDDASRHGQAGKTVRKIFAAADAKFAASAPARGDLLALQAEVDATLKQMEERL